MSSPVQDDNSLGAAMLAEFDSLHFPPNIDPQLLVLWIEREKAVIERRQQKDPPTPPWEPGRSLVRLFPAYIGITVMCLAVLLGLIQNHDTNTILKTACIAFLIYSIIGIFVGLIAERCVNESVETLLRDIIKRSHQAGQDNIP